MTGTIGTRSGGRGGRRGTDTCPGPRPAHNRHVPRCPSSERRPPPPFWSTGPLGAAPTIPQPVSPPSPCYGDFGLLGKGLFPEPPPSGGLLDWGGVGGFLEGNRG